MQCGHSANVLKLRTRLCIISAEQAHENKTKQKHENKANKTKIATTTKTSEKPVTEQEILPT